MKIVYRGGQAEFVEKKSRFIAQLSPAASEEEALGFIATVKKKYRDASHNCSAFVVGDNQELQRYSDDGEPQGTAGRPMLEVLLSQDIHNTAAVVTRYFGGTLLGTGGLVRAYEKSLQEGLAASTVLDLQEGIRLEIKSDYNAAGRISHLIGQRHFPLIDSSYTDEVTFTVLVPKDQASKIRAAVTEATSGRAEISRGEKLRYAMYEGSPVLFT